MSALLDALKAEQAALYGYGVLGSRATGLQAKRLQASYDAHQARRDQLLVLAHVRGVTPPPGAVFATPAGLGTPAGVQAAAAAIETSCLGVYAALVGAATGELRRLAAQALTDCAVAAAGYRAATTPLPGLEPPGPRSGRK